MASDNELNQVLDTIADADTRELARIGEAFIERLGDHGRNGAQALLDRLQENNGNYLTTEGLAQIESVEGVLSGRTDQL
jgi:hypothetical protein